MNKKLLASLVLGIAVISIPFKASADLVYAWDFAGLPATTTNNTATPDIINSTIGSATLNTSAFGLGSPQGINPEKTSFGGSTINIFAGAEAGTGTALAIAGTNANGKSLLFSFSMAGYQDLELSLATRGTSTGFDTGLWSWSVNGVDFFNLDGVNTATRVTSFSLATVDFAGISELDDAATAYVRYTLSGATSATGNNRIDNVQLNATAIAAVPEPSTASMLVLGGLLFFRAFRRKS